MDIAKENDLECTVFDEDDIRKMGMNRCSPWDRAPDAPSPDSPRLSLKPLSRRIALVGKT
jgi:hypothetical protein